MADRLFGDVEAILNQRNNDYGSFSDNAEMTHNLCATLKQGKNYLELSPTHLEAFHMMFHKISRLTCGDAYHLDSVQDIIGYAKLLEAYVIAEK